MGIIGAIVDCLGCVISGATLTFPSSLGAPLMRGGAQRSSDFSRESWTAYVIVSVVGKQSSGFGAHTISSTVVPGDETCSDSDAIRIVYSDALNTLLDNKSFQRWNQVLAS
jgi:hypothetical protein